MSIVTILQEQMVTSNKVSLNSSNDLPSSDLSLNQSEGEDAFEPMRTTRECGWCYLLLGFVILCTMLGNLMVCLAVIFDKRLQNITNFFLVSLAMTDMGVAVLVMPFAIVVAYNSGKIASVPKMYQCYFGSILTYVSISNCMHQNYYVMSGWRIGFL